MAKNSIKITFQEDESPAGENLLTYYESLTMNFFIFIFSQRC